MSEINFEAGEPIYSAAITHNTPGTSGLWLLAFNATSEENAKDKAVAQFEADGLPPERITEIEVTELIHQMGEGDSNGK